MAMPDPVQASGLANLDDIQRLLESSRDLPQIAPGALDDLALRLYEQLEPLYPDLVEATLAETGFIRSDCEEVVKASLDYVRGFPAYWAGMKELSEDPLTYSDGRTNREIAMSRVPWGSVVAILPQSAFLILALACLLNGLYTGNRVIIRAPAQSTQSAELLSAAIEKAAIPKSAVSVVLASARQFFDIVCNCEAPLLIHYLGSSQHAPDIMSKCFSAKKHAIIDGDGNAWIYVDQDTSVEHACEILTSGALRYNGQTCTSINGAVIHPHLYPLVRERLAQVWQNITCGNPLTEDVRVGPLLSKAQAQQVLGCAESSGGKILAGGKATDSLLRPTLVSEPASTSEMVTFGFFGPALWITPGEFGKFAELWQLNRYPLCAGALSRKLAPQEIITRLPNLARLCLNGDPSIEHIYEPWGGYPATGTNPVSHWCRKYARVVQVDHAV